MKKILLTLSLLAALFMLGSSNSLSAQNKEFWFVAPDASFTHDDRPIFFMITSGEAAETNVTLSIPANPQFKKQTIKLGAYQSYKVQFNNSDSIAMIENSILQSFKETKRGVLITADAPISAYYEINGAKNNQKEIFTLKGEKALGNEFYTPFQTNYVLSDGYNGEAYRQIQIVAAGDTKIHFTPTTQVANSTGATLEPNTTYTKNLKKGETLLLRELVRDNPVHTTPAQRRPSLMGSHIRAEGGKIAVTVFEDCVSSQGSDPIGDQIVPVDMLGTTHVVITGYTSGVTQDHVYILAVKNGTILNYKLNGVQKTKTLNEGEYEPIPIGNISNTTQHHIFETNTEHPVYCYHQSATTGELGGAMIPSMYALGARDISFYNQNLISNNIFLLFRNGAENDFKIRINGGAEEKLTIADKKHISDGLKGKWAFAKQELRKAEGTARIYNKKSAFALGYFASPGGATALYGYLSSFGRFSFEGGTKYVCGTDYTIDAGFAKEYIWTLPDGTVIQNDETDTYTATKSGIYKVKVDFDPEKFEGQVELIFNNFDADYQFPNAAFVDQAKDFKMQIKTTNDTYGNKFNVRYKWEFEGAGPGGTPLIVEYPKPSDANYNIGVPNTLPAEVKGVKWSTAGKKEIKLYMKSIQGGCETTVYKNIIVHDYSENVDATDCYVNPPKTVWTPKQTGATSTTVHILAQPFVGDVDNNGQLEVVTTNAYGSGYTFSDKIQVFDSELNLKKEIPTPVNMYTNSTTPLALVRIKPTDKYALIVVATHNEGDKYKLRAYTTEGLNGKLVWTSNNGASGAANEVSIYAENATSMASIASVSLVVGDINNDGIPEILAGDRIFDAASGKLLVTLPATSIVNGASVKNGRGLRTLNGGNWTYMPVLADVDNDGQLEVVAGNTTYKVTIDPNNSANNKAEVLAQVKIGASLMGDGFTSVADIDMDGQLDVVTIRHATAPIITVWNGVTGEIIAGPKAASVNGVGGSRVFIGNMRNVANEKKPYPEMAFSYSKKLVAFEYVASASTVANRLNQIWIQDTSDGSGGTTLSMFDFDQDGTAELVYRDESDLRIINGENGEDRGSLDCTSATHSEYPIVVDFDQDGHADIIVSGGTPGYTGIRLAKFSGVDNDWAPARSVWNQHGYNSVHVNDDLTIPKYQLNPGTEFPGEKDKNKPVYPYNGYLMQQTIISKEGTMLRPTANAQLSKKENIAYDYNANTDVMTIKNIIIENKKEGDKKGAAPIDAPFHITIYKVNGATKKKLVTYKHLTSIGIGAAATLNIAIPNFEQELPIANLLISINDNGEGLNPVQPVCETCAPNESGAFNGVKLDGIAWIDGSYRKCVGEKATFKSHTTLSGAEFTKQWFKPGNSAVWKTGATTEIANLAIGDPGQYTFRATNGTSKLSVTHVLPHLSVATNVMSWRSDAADHNWNNVKNWNTGTNSSTSGTRLQSVPAKCTSVHLPAPSTSGTKTKYPSLLSSTDATKGSDRTLYGQPIADTIIFHYGSELAYPHELDYQRAQVQYNFGYYDKTSGIPNNSQPGKNAEGANTPQIARETWYAVSAPLKKMVSGDFSFGGYPFTWQGTHNALANTGHVESIDFTKNFSKNDVELTNTYNTLGLKVAYYKGSTGYSNHKPLEALKGILKIPYYENANERGSHPAHSYDPITKTSSLYYFDNNTLQQLGSPVGKINRGNKNEAYRFVYENSDGKVVIEGGIAIYKLKVKVVGTNKRILIGNPFMSPINMERFYKANTGNIQNVYYVRKKDNTGWSSFACSGVDKNINSLEAFVIELAAGKNEVTLNFPLSGANALTGPEFSGTIARRLPISGALSVNINNPQGQGGDYAELTPRSTSNRVTKLISQFDHATPEAFFVDGSGNHYNQIQAYQEEQSEVGLIIKSSDTQNELTLNFAQVDQFSNTNNTHPVLIDKLLGVEQDLTQNNIYRFRQHTTANSQSQYADMKRFVIRFQKEGITQAGVNNNDLIVIYTNGHLSVKSTSQIKQVEIYTLSGQRMFAANKIDALSYDHDLTLITGNYIVKVTTADNQVISRKIMPNQ